MHVTLSGGNIGGIRQCILLFLDVCLFGCIHIHRDRTFSMPVHLDLGGDGPCLYR